MVPHQELQHCGRQTHPWLLHASEERFRSQRHYAVRISLLGRLVIYANISDSSIYACFLILTIYSLIPTTQARQAHAAKLAEKKAEKEKWANSPTDNEMTAEEQWQHMWELQQLPRTPGTAGGMKSPFTPRTQTFNQLEGGHYSVPAQPHAGYYSVADSHGVSPVDERAEYSYPIKGNQQTGSAY